MKNTINIITSLVFIAILNSCSLDEVSYTEKEKHEYMRNAAEAETVLLGVYENLTEEAMYGYHLSLYFTLGTDQAKVSGGTTDSWRDVPCNLYTSSAAFVQNTWAALYNAVYDANDFIERLSVAVENFTDSDKDKAAVYMAEARTLRALFYFELVRWYGNVVLMKTTAESRQHPSTFVQAPPAEVYEYIEQDLEYAIKTLPYASEDTYRSHNAFRISKAGAIGLLTKVYATWAGYPVRDESKWHKAVATAKPLVESGKHGLIEDFEQLWYNASNSLWDPTESLIEVSFYAAIISGGDPVGRIGKWNGVQAEQIDEDYIRINSYWSVVPTFISGWKDYYKDDEDKRWELSFADYQYDSKQNMFAIWNDKNKETGEIVKEHWFEEDMNKESGRSNKYNDALRPAKWDLIKYAQNHISDANYTNTNWHILRYSDVLLLYAEALNELNRGPVEDAYEALNMVRRRAGLSDVKTGLSYEEFQQTVRDERSYELCFEGHRKQDLIRWGIYYETIKKTYDDLLGWHDDAVDYYLVGDNTVKGKHELLPIPQRDLDLMKQCKQNPNW